MPEAKVLPFMAEDNDVIVFEESEVFMRAVLPLVEVILNVYPKVLVVETVIVEAVDSAKVIGEMLDNISREILGLFMDRVVEFSAYALLFKPSGLIAPTIDAKQQKRAEKINKLTILAEEQNMRIIISK